MIVPKMDLRQYTTDRQRKYVRFDNSRGNLVQVQTLDETGKVYQLYGFIVDESFGGINILLTTEYKFMINQICQVKIEGIGMVRAKIAWTRYLLNKRVNLGLEYINWVLYQILFLTL